MKSFWTVAAILALVLGTGCSSQPSSNETSDFVTQMAMKTKGDASKLTPEERKKMDEITKGNTEEVLRFNPAIKMQPAPPPPDNILLHQ